MMDYGGTPVLVAAMKGRDLDIANTLAARLTELLTRPPPATRPPEQAEERTSWPAFGPAPSVLGSEEGGA